MKKKNLSILIAPNAFKHSLAAGEVAQAIGAGLKAGDKEMVLTYFPIGDGGDGTIDLIIEHLGCERKSRIVTGPLGKPVEASYGLLRDQKTAFIEMADATGIKLLKPHELNPLKATSFGTGELLIDALDEGVEQIIIGMGGSATVDGGCGILAALGARFYDEKGNLLKANPEHLRHTTTVNLEQLDKRLEKVAIVVLCDVDNKLLGIDGAAAVFGPQKGANTADIQQLEGFLSTLSKQLQQLTGRDMAAVVSGGVAGGAAGGLYAALNAVLKSGIDHFMELTGFEQALAASDLLITGEGSLDSQTLGGKGPYGVAIKAKEKGIPVIAVAGKVPLCIDKAMYKAFDVLLPIGNEPIPLEEAFKVTRKNLVRTGTLIANFLGIPSR